MTDMTKEDITTNNGIIAEFMGATREQWYPPSKDTSGVHYSYPKDCYPDNEKYHCDVTLKYHTDWNWLLKVVERVYVISGYKSLLIRRLLGELDKEGVYSEIVGFIERYNKK